MKHYRQGDVLLRRCEKRPKGEFTYSSELTLARGEQTNHHHTAYPTSKRSQIGVLEIGGQRFIDVGTEYFLRHQEHGEIRIDPGCYEIIMEREYDPFEKVFKKVVD
jgi:hypothetical protein